MKLSVKLSPFVVMTLLFLPCISANAKKKTTHDASKIGFPEAFIRRVEGAQRFRDPAYFNLMAASGLQLGDPKALYARLQAAAAANEHYKALYLARIFTVLKPDAAAGWTNRASLASTLGLNEEATACQANAKDLQHLVSVPPSVLPGSALSIKPASLADWAAAMALLSDDTAAKTGTASLVAVNDSVSGIHQATEQEVQERNRSFQADGLTPPGPWATPEPIRLHHVLANAFSLRAEEPMHFKSSSAGGMFGAMVMTGLAGVQQNSNPVAAQRTQEAAQEMAGRASEVPSHYVGGSYTKITYANGREVSTIDHPHPTGEFETVGLPVPLLWASGALRDPIYAGLWKGTEKAKGRRYTVAEMDKNPSAQVKLSNAPEDLLFPKLASLCAGRSCSNPLTLTELILTTEDVNALAPALVSSFENNGYLRQAYIADNLIIDPTNGGRKMIGIDKDGTAFEVYSKPTIWLQPAH